VTPSVKGLATIHDKDILIYCISQLMAAVNAGRQIGRTLQLRAHDLLVATNRETSGDSPRSRTYATPPPAPALERGDRGDRGDRDHKEEINGIKDHSVARTATQATGGSTSWNLILFESGAFPSILLFLRSLCEGSRLATGFDIRHILACIRHFASP
jgi:hypothetical protein